MNPERYDHPKLPEKELVRLLRDKEHISITEGEHVALGEFDFGDLPGLSDSQQKWFIEFAEQCVLFLSGSTFKAKENDIELAAWRKEMSEKYGQAFRNFFIKNKMSRGRLAVYLGDLTDIIEILDKKRIQTNTANQIRALYASLPDLADFKNRDWDTRLKDVEQVSTAFREYIKLFTKST